MSSSLQPEQTILHFKILQKLGEGGMGEVYKAEDLKLGRAVAVKILPTAKKEDRMSRERFLQEARSASALNHPNIITIHSIETAEGHDFIVMEYVEGIDLAKRLQQGPLETQELFHLGTQVADALNAAHAAGIIHRDIKPSNIFITSRGNAKVLDFGLAKMTDMVGSAEAQTHVNLTEAGMIVGTVFYMSPEQTRGETLDPRSDIFSLGAVLYEAATGKVPFSGGTLLAIMHEVATHHPPAVSRFRDDLPEAFDSLLDRMMAKDRDERCTSAAEVMGVLQSLRHDPMTVATAAGSSGPKQPGVQAPAIVGRDGELKRLNEFFAMADSGSGKVVFVTGEPGIGKTWLTDAFTNTLRKERPDVIFTRGRCVEQYGPGEAYLPFLDAVGNMLNGKGAHRVIQVLRTHAPTWCLQFPSAFASTDAMKRSQLDAASASKERMLRELAEALVALTSTSALVILIEDLHWADPSSIDLLRYLTPRFDRKRMLLLGTFREEDAAANQPFRSYLLEAKAHKQCEDLPLPFLKADDIRQYLDQRFNPNDFSSNLSALLHAKTEGHALFVSSLIEVLDSEKFFGRTNGFWTLSRPLSAIDFQVPESVRSMIRKKLEGLSEEDRRILQYASVEGEVFSSLIVAALTGIEEITLEEHLDRIDRDHRLIVATGDEEFPDGALSTRYRFVHALYQNALYEDLVTRRRILLHRQAGEELLRRHGANAARVATQLARHYRLGRHHEKAVEYLMIAADNATRLYANAEAAGLYGTAIEELQELTRKQPESNTWAPLLARAHESLGDIHALGGHQDESRAAYAIALQFLDHTAHIDRARLLRKTAKSWESSRQWDMALQNYLAAELILGAPAADDSKDWWYEYVQLGLDRMWLHYTQAQLRELQDLSEKITPQIQSHGTPTQRARFYFGLLLGAYRRERYVISEERLQQAQQIYAASQETRHLGEMANGAFAFGFANLWAWKLNIAELYLNEGLAGARRIGDAILQARCITYLSVAFRLKNDLSQTSHFTDQALEISTAINMPEYAAIAYANRAWLAWRQANFTEAERLAQQAIDIWAQLKLVIPFQWLALWVLIDIDRPDSHLEKTIQWIRAILHPAQQKLRQNLELQLEKAIERFEAADTRAANAAIQSALELAKEYGYL